MKKFLPVFVAFISSLHLFAQPDPNSPHHFVIKGVAKNHGQNFWELGVTGFMGFETVSVLLTEDGHFSKTIPITHPQNIYLDLNEDGISLFAVPGDTIEVNWDNKDFANSFKVVSAQPWRQKELDLVQELYGGFYTKHGKLVEDMYDKKMADSVKFNMVRKLFAAQVQKALSFPRTINSRKIFCDLYFFHIALLRQGELLPKYDLSFPDVMSKRAADSLDLTRIYIKNVDESLFYQSREYRSFLFDYIRTYKPFNSYLSISTTQRPEPNYTLNDCYAGATFLPATPAILDWYTASAIMFGFAHYSFEGSQEAYRQFFPKMQTPMFRDTLQHFYTNIQRLKPGNAAPAFSLKNEEGKKVSLADFKGKVVYIDFWGVHCGPCVYDIKNKVPKLHEKYHGKDVVFLNVCIDVKEKEWQENIKKLQMDGVNLLAEGSVVNPVCIAYNINAIPHYVLIDQGGNIANNNARRPGELLRDKDNEIDKLLRIQSNP